MGFLDPFQSLHLVLALNCLIHLVRWSLQERHKRMQSYGFSRTSHEFLVSFGVVIQICYSWNSVSMSLLAPDSHFEGKMESNPFYFSVQFHKVPFSFPWCLTCLTWRCDWDYSCLRYVVIILKTQSFTFEDQVRQRTRFQVRHCLGMDWIRVNELKFNPDKADNFSVQMNDI